MDDTWIVYGYEDNDAMKWLPHLATIFGIGLLLGGIGIGIRSGEAPQLAFIMGTVGVILMAFGLTLYMFTEGVAGRRTGY